MDKYPVTIFLPAAGLGERLRPITNHLPKPLLPILGRPLIDIILHRITAVCIGQIGINLHYKPDMIRAWAKASPFADRITFFPEDPVLGTGGALKNADPFLANGPFLVHNSDILLDIDFSRLIETHLSRGNIATLATHRLPHLSNVVIDDNDLVMDVENPGASRPDPGRIASKVAYTGIAVYSPDILKFLPPGVSHATVAWLDAARAGRRVQALDFTGASWNDIGTPATYSAAVLDALRDDGETVYVSPSCQCGKIGMDGSMVLEAGSVVEDGAQLRNCIVMPEALVSGSHENRIIGPDYAIDLRETDMQPSRLAAELKIVSLTDSLFARHFGLAGPDLPGPETGESCASRLDDSHPARPDPRPEFPAAAILIGLGGSDRRYYRVRNDGKTAVLMECRPDDQDYERHLAYTRFFASHSVPVPDLIAADYARKTALFEDLGDASLYAYMKFPHERSHAEDIYRSVLDILITLHTGVTEHVHECPLLQSRIFDYDHLRWETGYFLQQFVVREREIALERKEVLDEELHRLALKTDAFPKGVIHRDFQSQNIMITEGGMPHVIDFQGARLAPPAYDVASVLWDPYQRLEDDVRDGLLTYYQIEIKKFTPAFDAAQFTESLLCCRLQRHMQALGAYAFLAGVRGKKYFFKHIPEALRLLKQDIALTVHEYPQLERLIYDLA